VPSAEIPVSPIDEAFFKEFREIIEKNLANPDFNEDQLRLELHMNQNNLSRKILGLTGEPLAQYILSYRLERAAQLLKANFGSVTRVAFKVGFSSTADFARCFKEKFHQLPTSFQSSIDTSEKITKK
jgi:AraC-like DNA-binding protein